MPYHVDDYQIAMEHTPEIARRIGTIFGLYVLIEFELVPALRWIANISPEQARVAMETHKQFSGKIAYIRAVCDVVQPDWPRDVEVGRAFATAALAASKIRNTYAHATYEWSGAEAPEPAVEQLVVRVQTNGLTGNVREEIATIRHLDAEIRFMKSVIVAMKNYSEARGANTPVDLQEIRALASLAHASWRDAS
jgi:hypothetical protein